MIFFSRRHRAARIAKGGKTMKKSVVIAAILAAAAVSLSVSAASAEPTPRCGADLYERAIYFIDENGSRVGLAVALNEVTAEDGSVKYYWACLNPEGADQKIPAAGFVFFDTEGSQSGFIPVDGDAGSANVTPSPDGSKLVLAVPEGPGSLECINTVYAFDGLEPLTSFHGSIVDWSGPCWADNSRFVYTSVDSTGMKKPGMGDADARYLSVSLFDVDSGTTQVLKAATPTDEYMMTSYRGGVVKMTHLYVDAVEQWAESGSEENGELHMESVYLWLPDWKPGEWWKTPKAMFSVDAKTMKVFTGEGKSRSPYDAELHVGRFFNRFSFDAEEIPMNYYWFTAGGEGDPAGEMPMLYVFTQIAPDDDLGTPGTEPSLATAFFVGEPERVCGVSVSPNGERLMVAMGEKESNVRDLDVYQLNLNGRGDCSHLATLRLACGDFFWCGPWRVAYSALNLEADLKSGREPGYALDVHVYDSAVDLDNRITESSNTVSYRLTGIGEDGSLEVERISVRDAKDWKNPKKEIRRRLNLSQPAAG